MSWHIYFDEINEEDWNVFDFYRAWIYANEGPFDKATDKLFKSLRAISNTSTDASKVGKANSLLDNIKDKRVELRNFWYDTKKVIDLHRIEQEKTNLELQKINGIIQAVKHVQRYAGALSNSAIVNLELASKPTVLVEKNVSESPTEEVLANEITLPSQSHDEDDSDYHKQKQRRTKSGRAIPNYSDQISKEESNVIGETRERSKNNVDNVFEDQEESGDGLRFVSEDAPYYHFNREILEIYNNAEQCDPIKMGVINLEDLQKNQTRPFKVISEIFKKDFRRCADDNINSEVKTMLIEIGNISDVSTAKSFVSNYKELESFEFDIVSVIQSFVVSIARTFTLIANKDRRNLDNDSRTRRGMIPDIKLLFIKRNVEIIVVEHAKNTSSDGRKKNIDDTQKIIVLMHDQITKIHKLLKEAGKDDDIKEIEVYGVVTSRLEVKIYVMHLSAPELYLFYKIFSFELPKTVRDFDILSNVLSCLIRFRKIVDNNYIRYISILRKDPVTPTQKIQWVVKIKQSPHSINEELKRKRQEIVDS
ncbi:15989_t:CDS:2 [Gigaspora margarita]|uniref:15989_t:CDS:1 n=1 Tax=Gigaspora margarita TaxID=4874 RepID=A0ABN7UJ08_GIGMA|nr:15989_t:CDS:2 [Gigaspora margarita]